MVIAFEISIEGCIGFVIPIGTSNEFKNFMGRVELEKRCVNTNRD